MAKLCEDLLAGDNTSAAARVRPLLDSGAWTDAALALVEFELPGWVIRRLEFEDGQWHCRLSRCANLPIALDDTVDGAHAVLALAIFGALLEARQQDLPAKAQASAVGSGGRATCRAFHTMAVDNFG